MPDQIHKTHLEYEITHGWKVVCSCGWNSGYMGMAGGDAYTTKERGIADKGHEAYIRKQEEDETRHGESRDGKTTNSK